MNKFLSASLCAVLGVVGSVGAVQANDSVVVGVLAPLSGFAAADGQSAVTSVKLAAEDINDQGGLLGKQIELKVYDDQADPKQAVNFARRLVEKDHVSFVINASYSGAALASSPVFNKAKIPSMVAYSVAPDVTKGHPYVFRVGLMGDVEGRVGAVLAKKLGAGRVAMLNIKNDFGQSLETGFKHEQEAQGLDIVYSGTFDLGNKNFTPQLAQIKASRPDVIYASGYYAGAATLVRQAKRLGIKAPIIGQDGYDSPKFIELGGNATNGVYLTTQLDRDSDQTDVQKYLKAYKKVAGKPADMVGATGYAAMEAMAGAIKKAQSFNGDAIRKALEGMHDIDTVVGHIYQWDDDGDPIKTATVQMVKNGQFHQYMNITDRQLLTP